MKCLKVMLLAIICSRVDSSIEKDKAHFGSGHNTDIDHEAFLGKDQAHAFDELSPEESKLKLSKILEKVDTDISGEITVEELQDWIKVQMMDYIKRDAQKAMVQEDTDKDGVITWDEYQKNTYGDKHDDFDDMVEHDKTRFGLADTNDDNNLNIEEFTSFLHPEEFEHMAGVVVDETLDDMDEDDDGKISLAEYLGEFMDENDFDDDDDEDDDDDDWIEQEKRTFAEEKDKNGDGYLDRDELEAWIVPSEVNYSQEEAEHLVKKSDSNHDGVLSYDEILEHHELFVGSQATDYGRLLHEEL